MTLFFEEAGVLNRSAFFIVGLALVVFTCNFSYAQQTFGIDPTGRSGDEPRQLLEEQEEPSPPIQILPQLPPPSPEKKTERLQLGRVFIRRITITGSTIFSDEDLTEVTHPYLNKELTAEDLEALRRALTLFYINKGYINSGAIIPDQTVADGAITFHVIEGGLTRTEVEGVRRFRPGYISDRIALGAKFPLNVNRLQERLQLLQQDPRIERINAKLKPGVRPGQSILNVRVAERSPYKFWLRFDNYQSPSVGAERGQATFSHQNLTGHGDILSFGYGISEGVDPRINASYSLPLNARDTTLILSYERNDFVVLEEPFGALDIESESEIYGVTLRHPVYRSLNQEFALAITGEHLQNKTFLLGVPFSFSLGSENGESRVSAIRFSQEWTHRTQAQAISVYSRFSFGIDALDATINDDSTIPDSRFFSWLGQFQWARRLGLWDTQLIFRTDLQLTNDPLMSLEQIAVGGRYSVRGYRENQMVRDAGLISSLEFRIPLIQNRSWADVLQLVPFVDYGEARNKEGVNPDPGDISSIGLGLRWTVTLPPPFHVTPQFEIYWGYALRDMESSEWDLQDDGIHFQLTIAAF